MTRLNIPLFVALAASILSAVPANARETLPHQRMIRKRGPSIGGPGPIGGAAAVIGLHVRQNEPSGSASVSATGASSSTAAAASSSSTAASATSASPTSSAAVSTTSSSSSAAASSSTTSGGLLDSLTAILGSSTSSTVSSTSTSSTPTTSSAAPTTTSTSQSQAPQTTSTPAAQTPTLNIATTPAASATVRNPSVSVVAITSTQAAAAAASSSAAAEKTRKITRNTIVSLVVIASCIGGAIGIWTVIRKWKLSPSEKFDDRMQPIDWAPPPANGVSEEAIEEKSKHRRVGSGASHGSFTSGGVGQSEQGHGAKGAMYADSQYSHGYGNQPQDFPPPHDFTAGTAQAGGYGQYYGNQQYAAGPGYADLQRGPSVSESNYSHGADVSRGMSYSRGHGAYDSQSGPAPPMPNPYGGEYGYEDYNHPAPQAGQQPQAQGQAPYRAF